MREKLIEWISEFRELDEPGDGRTWTEHLADFLAERLSAYENNLAVSRTVLRETQIKFEKAEHDRDRYARKIEELTEENERLRWISASVCVGDVMTPEEMEELRAVPGHGDPVGEPGECVLKHKCVADTVRKMRDRLKELYTDEIITDDMTVAIGVIKQNIDDVAEEIAEGVCDAPKDAVRATTEDLHTRFAMHFGTYTDKDTVKVSEVFRLLRKFEGEICDTTN